MRIFFQMLYHYTFFFSIQNLFVSYKTAFKTSVSISGRFYCCVKEKKNTYKVKHLRLTQGIKHF